MKEKTMNLLTKSSQFVREVKFEMSKVSWPTLEELKGSTMVVVFLSLAFAVYIFAADWVLSQLIKLLYSYVASA
jgi:preprotein translocase subunit SecE